MVWYDEWCKGCCYRFIIINARMKQYEVEKIHCFEWKIIPGGLMIIGEKKYYFITFEDKKIESKIKAIMLPSREMFPGTDEND